MQIHMETTLQRSTWIKVITSMLAFVLSFYQSLMVDLQDLIHAAI